MKRKHILLCLLSAAALLFGGCTMQTVDQMYQLPKRSESYKDLQYAIDGAMSDLEYCAPLAGENQQTVQMADLDGDGEAEFLLFARGTSERPLRILIFRSQNGGYVHTDTIESNGFAFDQVEYVRMSRRGGVELVVGRLLSDQVIRSVTVYTFVNGEAEQLMTANYTKFLTTDMDGDGLSELFLLRPGPTETDNGVAELYHMVQGTMERFNEVEMSQSADRLKRVIVGRLHGGQTAVYAASTVGDTSMITDIYALKEGRLTNVTLANATGTGTGLTLRNYNVYADDIDDDGVAELPALTVMQPLEDNQDGDRQNLIRWYAMTIDGDEVDKMFTYHNFVGGWYLELDRALAPQITVRQRGNHYEFYLWNADRNDARKLLTISAFTGQNREEQAVSEKRFVLYRTDTVIYAAGLESGAGQYGFNQTNLIHSFHLIYQDWNMGET